MIAHSLLAVEPERGRSVDGKELKVGIGLVHRVRLQLGVECPIADTRSGELRLGYRMSIAEHVESNHVANICSDIVWFEQELVGAIP